MKEMQIENQFYETVVAWFGDIEIGEIFEIENSETSVETFLKTENIEIPLSKNKKQIYNCANIRNGKLRYFQDSQKLFWCKNAVLNLRPKF